MELSVSQEVAVPRERVWSEIGDLPSLAARLGMRSLTVSDAEGRGAPVPGRVWHARLDIGGQAREGVFKVRDATPPERLDLIGEFGTVTVTLLAGIVGRGDAESRVDIAVTANARDLGGRMFLGSLRVMRPALEAKLAQRLADCAREIEAAAIGGDQPARPGSAG